MEAGLRHYKPEESSHTLVSFSYTTGSWPHTRLLTRELMCTLRPGGKLDGEIMNCYLSLIVKEMRNVYAFDTKFLSSQLPWMYEKGLKSQSEQDKVHVEKYREYFGKLTDGVDILGQDFILIPVHVANCHWCLVVVENQHKTSGKPVGSYALTFYDSKGGEIFEEQGNFYDWKDYLRYVKLYLNDESRKTNQRLDFEEELITVPVQTNDHDCGVFVCMYAKFVTQFGEASFRQDDMLGFRQQVFCELIYKKLL